MAEVRYRQNEVRKMWYLTSLLIVYVCATSGELRPPPISHNLGGGVFILEAIMLVSKDLEVAQMQLSALRTIADFYKKQQNKLRRWIAEASDEEIIDMLNEGEPE